MVFCEGKGSEPDCVTGLRSLSEVAENSTLSIEVSSVHGVPYTLVDNAVTLNRHVVAAAVACQASIIVTNNLQDFPAPALRGHGMTAVTPDALFLKR